MTLHISFESNPNARDIEVLGDGIKAYAKEKKALPPWDYFVFFIRDHDNNIMGGCDGNALYGCLYIDQLWISETIKHAGWGNKLINAALDYGKKRLDRPEIYSNLHFLQVFVHLSSLLWNGMILIG